MLAGFPCHYRSLRMSAFFPEQFQPIDDRRTARETFRRSVREVQVEIFSYCNRVCPYCSASTVNRHQGNRHIRDDHFRKIMADLGEISYDRRVGVSLYNEPLADRIVLKRIAVIHETLQKTMIYCFSNGDYLEREYLQALTGAGLNELFVSIHLGPEQPYNDGKIIAAMDKIATSCGLAFDVLQVIPGVRMAAKAVHDGLKIEILALDYLAHGQDRGALMENIGNVQPRKAPCERPLDTFVVSCGGVVPCCQIFAERPEHHPYIIGNLSDFDEIFTAFTCRVMAEWRLEIVDFGPKREPCRTCSDGDFQVSQEEIGLRKMIKELINEELTGDGRAL